MSAILIDGFELGGVREEEVTASAQASLQTSVVATGVYALEHDYTPDNPQAQYAFTQIVGANDNFFHFRVRITALPAVTTELLTIGSGGNTRRKIQINTSGNIIITDGANSVTSSTALAINTWYRIEAECRWTIGDPYDELKINGSSEGSATNLSAGGGGGLNPLTLGDNQKNETKANCIIYIDDFYINSSAGSTNNSWPGNIKILASIPIGQSPDSGYNDFTGSPNNTNKYLNWDEIPHDGDFSYNEGPAGNPPWEQLSTFQSASTVGLAAGDTIVAVATKVLANLNSTQTNTGDILVRDNSTDYTTDIALNGDSLYHYFRRIDDIAPRGSVWTQAIFNSFQAGAQVASGQVSGAAHRYTHVSCHIAYTPAVAGGDVVWSKMRPGGFWSPF